MADSRSGVSSNQGMREITLKQIQEQKSFVREYCQQFYIPQNEEIEGNQLDIQTELENHDISTARSGVVENTAGPNPDIQKEDITSGMPTTGTPMNAIIPYVNEAESEQLENGAVDEMPNDMQPMMEEMESVLYSISFGK